MNVVIRTAEREQWLYGSGQPNQVFVAMDGDCMAGYIAVGPNIGRPYNRDGEVAGFFVRKPYRHMGVGIRLLKTGITYLRELGYHQVVIFNHHESEANGFYRRLGGEVVFCETRSLAFYHHDPAQLRRDHRRRAGPPLRRYRAHHLSRR